MLSGSFYKNTCLKKNVSTLGSLHFRSFESDFNISFSEYVALELAAIIHGMPFKFLSILQHPLARIKCRWNASIYLSLYTSSPSIITEYYAKGCVRGNKRKKIK